MLKSIGLENFKTFKKLDNFELNPLTVLCGTNSSGKSTIIKTILLCKQTLDVSYRGVEGFSYNGEFVKLGPPKIWPFNNEQNKEIKFRFTFDTSKFTRKHYTRVIRQLLGLYPRPRSVNSDEYELNFTLGFIPNPRADGGMEVTDYHLNIRKIIDIKTKTSFVESVSTRKIRKPVMDIRIHGNPKTDDYTVSWKNLPDRQRFAPKNRKYFADDPELDKLRKIGTITELRYPPFLSFIRLARPKPETEFENELHYGILREIVAISWRLEELFEQIFDGFLYLGPIRGEPKRRIFDEGEFSGNIGIKGENAPFIYDRYKQDRVKFCYFDSKENKFRSKTTSLRIALTESLNALGIHNFKLKKTGNEIFSFLLNSSEYSDHDVSIADVGFGVSQVVPIIIQGLLLDEQSTLMIEQPELHLHPKMQMKLADFFLSLVLSGKKLIIETHSEHIINRLVRRVVEDTENQLNPLVGVNFISKSKNGSKIEKVELSETDGIVNWPDEFFDQAADEQQKIMTAIIKTK